MSALSTLSAKHKYWYIALIFIIGLISVYDNCLTIIYSPTIYNDEANPMGRVILNKGGLYVFVLAKSYATILVVVLCYWIVHTKYHKTILAVFVFQLILFWYLTFDHKNGPFALPMKDVIEFYKDPHKIEIRPYR